MQRLPDEVANGDKGHENQQLNPRNAGESLAVSLPPWSTAKGTPQSVLDAVCDAETLERIADSLADENDAAYGVWALIQEAACINLYSAARCAHAAFRACPALRGE